MLYIRNVVRAECKIWHFISLLNTDLLAPCYLSTTCSSSGLQDKKKKNKLWLSTLPTMHLPKNLRIASLVKPKHTSSQINRHPTATFKDKTFVQMIKSICSNLWEIHLSNQPGDEGQHEGKRIREAGGRRTGDE